MFSLSLSVSRTPPGIYIPENSLDFRGVHRSIELACRLSPGSLSSPCEMTESFRFCICDARATPSAFFRARSSLGRARARGYIRRIVGAEATGVEGMTATREVMEVMA